VVGSSYSCVSSISQLVRQYVLIIVMRMFYGKYLEKVEQGWIVGRNEEDAKRKAAAKFSKWSLTIYIYNRCLLDC